MTTTPGLRDTPWLKDLIQKNKGEIPEIVVLKGYLYVPEKGETTVKLFLDPELRCYLVINSEDVLQSLSEVQGETLLQPCYVWVKRSATIIDHTTPVKQEYEAKYLEGRIVQDYPERSEFRFGVLCGPPDCASQEGAGPPVPITYGGYGGEITGCCQHGVPGGYGCCRPRGSGACAAWAPGGYAGGTPPAYLRGGPRQPLAASYGYPAGGYGGYPGGGYGGYGPGGYGAYWGGGPGAYPPPPWSPPFGAAGGVSTYYGCPPTTGCASPYPACRS